MFSKSSEEVIFGGPPTEKVTLSEFSSGLLRKHVSSILSLENYLEMSHAKTMFTRYKSFFLLWLKLKHGLRRV